MTTLKDIAYKAGVNISTVSKALRDSTDINKDTKLRIKKIAKEMNYHIKSDKNRCMEGLGLIGVVCPEIRSNYYSQIVSAIEEETKRNGYSLIVGCTDFGVENERYFLKSFNRSNCAGIIFITESEDVEEILKEYRTENNQPLVLIAQNTETKEFDCIKIDDEYGVRLALQHLISSGHKNIGYIGDMLSSTRLNTFLKIMKENNIAINQNWIMESNERFEKCGYNLMKKIIVAGEMPTAVMGAYDDIAIGAIKALHDNGFVVPKDISVVGIDNIRSASYISPELTTVAAPIDEMCRIAVKLLLKKIKDNNYKIVQNVKLSPFLVQRNTVKKIN
ncbi:MAG TPA: LacI family transcriptional regulator [Clostridiaceae bacterium]|nr:LacI family transcriptional regulator [Clostridiaceae bacterium]